MEDKMWLKNVSKFQKMSQLNRILYYILIRPLL